MTDQKARMNELVMRLSQAARAYYTENREIMPNIEYDRLYDELLALEEETGIVLAGSPTKQVGYAVAEELPKEAHASRMLSLDKTKSREELASWLGDQEGLLSWKLDGLTVVMTYEEGRLTKAVTRGNGEVGEVITANAETFLNAPAKIPFLGRVIVRGEAIITYSDFRRINSAIPEAEAQYKNPRNLCSGSVRQLDSAVTASRNVRFYAFSLAAAEGMTFSLRREQLEWLGKQGFDVVEYVPVKEGASGKGGTLSVSEGVDRFEDRVADFDLPSDGLVLIYDDIAYGRSLGETAKFPRDSIAFKWQDELAETTLRQVEWSPSRTGLINPVAIFEPVELEGSTVSRASLHNISILRELGLGIGDRITVYKANMIIPQIADNLTGSDNLVIPDRCPACGGPTNIHNENDVQVLVCANQDCPAKKIKSFGLFVSRDAMNIDGLSEQTIEKLAGKGLIIEPADFFKLGNHREAIVSMEGFGEKSFEKMVAATEKARHTTPERLLYALGIAGIGAANARLIARHCKQDWERIQNLTKEELIQIDGVGEVMAEAFVNWFADQKNASLLEHILAEVDFVSGQGQNEEQTLEGKIFVITGSLDRFANRKALQAEIESRGGKVSGSVSNKTSALINNDINSASSKNKKAKELSIPILTEEEFCREYSIEP